MEFARSRAVALAVLALAVEARAQCPSWDDGFAAPQNGLGNSVHALGSFDLGSGPRLYVGGTFPTAGSLQIPFVASWDGTRWSALGALGLDYWVYALAQFDSGSGPELYAAGDFEHADGVLAGRIARFDGTSWSAVGPPGAGFWGYWDEAHALAVFDDGSGPALYVGGEFSSIAGVSTDGIARWNGTTWSTVGLPLSVPGHFSGVVKALTVFDDGSGPALYAGGRMQLFLGGLSEVARWDGTSWTLLPTNPTWQGVVHALAGHDDGTGPALYAGGWNLTTPAGTPELGVLRWDGTSWSPVGPTTTARGPRSTPAARSTRSPGCRRAGSPNGTARAGPRSASRSRGRTGTCSR